MRIHDRYVLGLFLKILFFCALSIVLVYEIGDVFERIDSFIDHQAKATSIAMYYVYMLADVVRLTFPVDVMLATMFTLGILAKNNEIVALLASGVSMLRLSAPLLGSGLLAVGASAALSEFVVPTTNSRMLRVQRVEIDKRPALDDPIRRDFTYRGEHGYLYYMRIFNIEDKRMTGVIVHQYQAGKVVARLDAETAEWRDGIWEFHDGFYRTFQ